MDNLNPNGLCCSQSSEALRDLLKKCNCDKLIKDISSSDLTESDRILIKMLHKKCPIIARAKYEIETLDKKFDQHMNQLKKYRLVTKSKKTYIIIIVLLGILLTGWIFIIYGVILGSLLCTKTSVNCRILDTLILRIPGLYWSNDGNERQCKVF